MAASTAPADLRARTRRRPPVVERWEPAFAEALAAALAGGPGAVAWAEGRDPRRFFDSLGGRLLPLSPAMLDAAGPAAWDETARQLRRAGIAFVLVDRTAAPAGPWLDSAAASLRVRLRDAVETPGFVPLVVGSGWALHRVATAGRPPDDLARRVLARARLILTGGRPARVTDAIAEAGAVTVSLHAGSGRRLAARTAWTVDAAARALRRAWPAIRANDPRERLPTLGLGVQIHGTPCLLTDHRATALEPLVAHGRHGLALEDGAVDGLRALEEGIAGPLQALETLLLETGRDAFLRPAPSPAVARSRPRVLAEDAWTRRDAPALRRLDGDVWLEPPDDPEARPLLRLHRGVPLVPETAVTREAVGEALDLGVRRLLADQRPDGGFPTLLRPGAAPAPANRPSRIGRHAMTVLALAQVLRHRPDDALRAAVEHGLAHALARRAEMTPPTAAVVLLALLEPLVPQGAGQRDPARSRAVADVAQAMLARPAAMAAAVTPEPEPDAEDTAAAMVPALARLAVHTGDPKITAAAEREVERLAEAWYVLAGTRDADGIHPEPVRVAMTGRAPWVALAAETLHAAGLGSGHADLALAVQAWVAETLLVTPDRAPEPDTLGALFKRRGEAPEVTSCRGLATAAAALRVARASGGPTAPHEDALRWGARFCLQLQYHGPGTTWFLERPDALRGGLRFSLTASAVRLDWTARALAGLAAAQVLLWPAAPESARTAEPPPAPQRQEAPA